MHSYPSVGQVVGDKYRVVRVLGEGGMGLVLEAVNVTTGKRVALKWMHPHVSDPVAAERLMREAQLATRIRHRNVIDIYDVHRHEAALFLVMEYLEGESLRALLRRGTATCAEVLGVLLGAMRGAAAAHKQGVIHRDIKPENIFLCGAPGEPECTPKLLDFGISKLALFDTNQPPLTRAGALFGTPMYMSYEQVTGAHELDVRTDVYSFGVVLYEALTGRLPFEADTFPAIIIQIATQAPSPMRRWVDHVPSGLERAVLSALHRNREHRPSGIEALMAAVEPYTRDPTLQRALVPAHSASMPPSLPVHVGERSVPASSSSYPKAPGGGRKGRIAAAVGAVALIGTLGAVALRPQPAAPVLPAQPPAIPSQGAAGAAELTKEVAPASPAPAAPERPAPADVPPTAPAPRLDGGARPAPWNAAASKPLKPWMRPNPAWTRPQGVAPKPAQPAPAPPRPVEPPRGSDRRIATPGQDEF